MENQATATTLPATATVGAVHLTVTDLDRAVAFYTERLGFRLQGRTADSARLGASASDLLVLVGRPDARRHRGTTGLYHFAVLVPSRPDLARALQHLIETRTPLTGASDHLVSEALYLSDPDGNGIEIYRDRPRDRWPIVDGRLRMSTDPLDLEGLLEDRGADGARWIGLPAETRIGHVHLHVSRIEPSERFYARVLGFDLTQRFGRSALFLSAGGYHHHIGLNTWAGVGAPPPPEGAVGLRRFEILLPDSAAIENVAARAREAGAPVTVTDFADVTDPSGNHIAFLPHPQSK